MGKITGNEPANMFSTHERGLTILQQFSMAAMQGILSGASIDNENGIFVNGGVIRPEFAAKESVLLAKSLIVELNKEV